MFEQALLDAAYQQAYETYNETWKAEQRKLRDQRLLDNITARSFASQRYKSDMWYEEIKNAGEHTGYMFITVNPKSSFTLQDLKNAVNAFVDSGVNYIAAIAYAFEVTDNSDRAPHVHMLVRKHPHASQPKFLDYINGKFRHLVGNVRHIDKKHIIPEEVQAVYDYITKTQYTPQKQFLLDTWRIENNLEKVYLKGSLTC